MAPTPSSNADHKQTRPTPSSCSPLVSLPGYRGLTLEHFRMQRNQFDEDGNPLPPGLYRWHERLVQVVTNATSGRKQRLIDVATGAIIHHYTDRTAVALRGHPDAALEDFAIERIPTKGVGHYRWRDRDVRVIYVEGRMDRILDDEDGRPIHIFAEDDANDAAAVDPDMLDEDTYRFDRAATAARMAHMVESSAADGGPPLSSVHTVWPQPTDEGLDHVGTVIWLHEVGDSDPARTGGGIAAQLELPWCKFVLVGAPVRPVRLLPGRPAAPAWFDLAALNATAGAAAGEDAAELDRAARLVGRVIMDEIERGVPPARIVVGGVGQGGCVALCAALREYPWPDPEQDRLGPAAAGEDVPAVRTAPVGAAVGLSTWMPAALRGLAPAWAGRLRPTYWRGKKVGVRGGVPLLLAHGRADPFVPYALGKACRRAAEAIGFSVDWFRYTELRGHGVCAREMFDVKVFLCRKAVPDPRFRLAPLIGWEPRFRAGTAAAEEAGLAVDSDQLAALDDGTVGAVDAEAGSDEPAAGERESDSDGPQYLR